MRRRTVPLMFHAFCLCSVLVIFAGNVQGDVLGKLWENDLTGDASIVPAGAPDLVFTSPAINYISGGLYTIGEFLNGPTYLSGALHAGDSIADTHIQLTGGIFLNAGVNHFEIAHDDGLVISIDGIGQVLSEPGTSPGILEPFSVTAPATGLYNFTLDYNECCGAPGVLVWTGLSTNPIGVPEGGSSLVFFSLSISLVFALGKGVDSRSGANPPRPDLAS